MTYFMAGYLVFLAVLFAYVRRLHLKTRELSKRLDDALAQNAK